MKKNGSYVSNSVAKNVAVANSAPTSNSFNDWMNEIRSSLSLNDAVYAARAEEAKKAAMRERMAAARQVAADKRAAAKFTAAVGTIGEVTIDKKAIIADTRGMYQALTYDAKRLIAEDCYKVLTDAEASLKVIEQQIADKESAMSVTVALAFITDDITLDDKASIAEMRKAYNALTENAKTLVEGYKNLTDAENKIAKIEHEIFLAKQREISAKDRELSLIASNARAFRNQQESLKQAALTGYHRIQANVVITLAPYINIMDSKDEAKKEEAQKALKSVSYHLEDVGFIFYQMYKRANQARCAQHGGMVADELEKAVKKITHGSALSDYSLDEIKAKFTNRYYQVGKYFVFPQGAVFTLERDSKNQTWINIYTISKDLTLYQIDGYVLDPKPAEDEE